MLEFGLKGVPICQVYHPQDHHTLQEDIGTDSGLNTVFKMALLSSSHPQIPPTKKLGTEPAMDSQSKLFAPFRREEEYFDKILLVVC